VLVGAVAASPVVVTKVSTALLVVTVCPPTTPFPAALTTNGIIAPLVTPWVVGTFTYIAVVTGIVALPVKVNLPAVVAVMIVVLIVVAVLPELNVVLPVEATAPKLIIPVPAKTIAPVLAFATPKANVPPVFTVIAPTDVPPFNVARPPTVMVSAEIFPANVTPAAFDTDMVFAFPLASLMAPETDCALVPVKLRLLAVFAGDVNATVPVIFPVTFMVIAPAAPTVPAVFPRATIPAVPFASVVIAVLPTMLLKVATIDPPAPPLPPVPAIGTAPESPPIPPVRVTMAVVVPVLVVMGVPEVVSPLHKQAQPLP